MYWVDCKRLGRQQVVQGWQLSTTTSTVGTFNKLFKQWFRYSLCYGTSTTTCEMYFDPNTATSLITGNTTLHTLQQQLYQQIQYVYLQIVEHRGLLEVLVVDIHTPVNRFK
ncbi:MAG: hypothetical protein LC127_16430 [Chitinophagales bacterium]|nr:hypothetical protein [Chitinophagales bacterium]